MPTAYTTKVLKGESFEEFALDTITAFSYLARQLKESGHDALPDPHDPSVAKYYKEKLEAAEKRLKVATKITFNQAARKAKAEFNKTKTTYNELIAREANNAFKLAEMLKKVVAYQPPSGAAFSAHKEYMIKQLKETMDSDADPSRYIQELLQLKPLTGSEWKKKEIKEAKHDIEYAEKEIKKEIDYLQREVDFISKLRQTVKAQAL